MTVLRRLQDWYARQCNEEWEHRYGVKIDTCDNPGWWVRIDLVGTSLANGTYPRVAEGLRDDGHPRAERWIHCYVDDGVWNGVGDETQLERILTLFLDWAES